MFLKWIDGIPVQVSGQLSKVAEHWAVLVTVAAVTAAIAEDVQAWFAIVDQ